MCVCVCGGGGGGSHGKLNGFHYKTKNSTYKETLSFPSEFMCDEIVLHFECFLE